MRLHDDGTLSLSPSDLSSHLACPHLTTLSLAAARGEIVKPKLDSPHRDLIFSKGNEHEAAYLARLEAEGRSIVRIPTYDDEGFEADEAQRLTEEAIRAGDADVDLPAVSHRRHVARLRGLPRAAAGRWLRAGRHEARAHREAGARVAADVLRRAGRADLGAAGRARARRERARRAGDVSRRRVPGVLPARARAVPRGARRGAARRTAGRRATAGSATSATCAGSSAWTTTTSRSSRGCGACRPRR